MINLVELTMLITALAYLYLIISAIVTTVSFNSHIKSTYYTGYGIKDLKNYNLILDTLFFLIAVPLAITLNNSTLILIVTVLYGFVLVGLSALFTIKIGYKFIINQSLIYILLSLLFLILGVILGIFKLSYLGVGYFHSVIISVVIAQFGLLSLKKDI